VPIPDLVSKRLVVVLGKGGVGRTTVATALALDLAQRGRRVLLYQAGAKEKVSAQLGGPAVGEAVVAVRPNLWAVNPNPTSAIHEYGLMVLRYETIYRMVFENRISKALIRAIPGLDDYSILGKLWWHTTEELAGKPRWDTIVFDAPATGHAVSMLRLPRAILGAVPEGPLTRDAVKVRAMLEDPKTTAAMLVTLAEDMPTNETIELAANLTREVGMKPVGIVVNQLFPDLFPPGSPSRAVLDALGAGAGDPVLAPAVRRAHLALARRELNTRYLETLATALPLPTAYLPILLSPTVGPQETQVLAKMLADQRSS
jgi:anion-transporting  ArsA/GET3 family ATPase